MPGYAQLGEVRTYYEEDGSGPPLVLLHPGGADSRVFEEVVAGLAGRFRVFRPDRRGHGRTPDVEGPISYELMARDTIAFLEEIVGGPAFLVGHSDGALVALVLALRRPDLVRRLVFATGVFHHDGWEKGVLDGEPPEWLRQSYGELSPDGIGHYDVVVAKLAAMHASEPAFTEADLRQVTVRTLIMVADDDEVRFEHAVAMYRSMPDAELAVVPGTSHGLLVEKADLCNYLMTEFLTKDPVQTFAPIRRAGS
jgi:pimeloyl-ACP methyl ester carboxylesterase